MKLTILILYAVLMFMPKYGLAQSNVNNEQDSDNDGISNFREIYTYNSDPNNPDSDLDGFNDGNEVQFGFDPNRKSNDRLEKNIVVVLGDQSLSYRLGDYVIESIKISSGIYKTPTPKGEFKILQKLPLVNYLGEGYAYRNTRWNMKFKNSFYIHGAFWHNAFGSPMSHGCVNVSYADMEKLYNWADIGTKLVIK